MIFFFATDIETFTVQLRSTEAELDEEVMEEMRHTLVEAMNDPSAQIVLAPCYYAEENKENGVADGGKHEAQWLEIKMSGEHSSDSLLKEMLETIEHFDLEVMDLNMEEFGETDLEIFHVKDREVRVFLKAVDHRSLAQDYG